MLINEAKKIVPDVVIVLGEELGRFRDASKTLYKFLEAFTWSGKVERLGFDEVFMDVSDIIDFNQALLNPNDLAHSFFQLKHDDPTIGFPFDATKVAGPTFPKSGLIPSPTAEGALMIRLLLGSHLAQHLRWSLEEQKGYTSTVGISTNKLTSKLAGNVNKPKDQTTLLPPYTVPDGPDNASESNVTKFIDGHDIGKIPGIGFKTSQLIRNHILSRSAEFKEDLTIGATEESVSARDVRLFPGMGPELLEQILGGPGSVRGIGRKVWGLINGVDDTEVQQARKIPSQISIEDSYQRMDNMPQVVKELRILATSLMKRMHTDLLEDDDDDSGSTKRWIAHPKTIRISTRPRSLVAPSGENFRPFNRISRSGPLPSFVFNLKESLDATVEKLLQQTLIKMFRKLHPYPSGWNLSLINIGVTNMAETASHDGRGTGRDIGRMFKKQEEVLKEWKVEDRDVPPDPLPQAEEVQLTNTIPDRILKEQGKVFEEWKAEEKDMFLPTENERVGTILADPSAGNEALGGTTVGSEDAIQATQNTVREEDLWEDDEEDEDESREQCQECGAVMPPFAMAAHERFHFLEQ